MIDNDYYNREAGTWWTEKEGPLAIIRYTMNPIRFAYVMKHLVNLSYDYRGRKVLDIGCGGGFLTEEIAKFGLDATGLDPSVPSLHAARSHAAAMNLRIDYQEGFGEKLPFPDNHFDMVFCLDVLEHVKDFRQIIREVRRVLKPGGYFFFETVNRTLLSWFIVIFLFQKFPLTRIIPRDIHKWKYFIRPKELRRAMEDAGILPQDMQGILPGYNFTYNFLLVRRMVANKISFHDLCKLFRCHESAYKGLCYVGFGVKT
jgi:2-polyprenyl-6-hydroxyphenyl methylase/3-demethylubiquinone-9 3-methyltransferase